MTGRGESEAKALLLLYEAPWRNTRRSHGQPLSRPRSDSTYEVKRRPLLQACSPNFHADRSKNRSASGSARTRRHAPGPSVERGVWPLTESARQSPSNRRSDAKSANCFSECHTRILTFGRCLTSKGSRPLKEGREEGYEQLESAVDALGFYDSQGNIT